MLTAKSTRLAAGVKIFGTVAELKSLYDTISDREAIQMFRNHLEEEGAKEGCASTCDIGR